MISQTDTSDYVTCPLDVAHRILKSRLQFHIVKCIKNHTLETKIRCPWNPLHFVERCEYLDHLNNKCKDLVNVMGSRIVMEEDKGVDVASIPVGTTNAVSNSTTEDWDAEPCVGTYDPLKQIEDRPILRGSIGLSKAKRKEFRLQERKRHQQLEEVLPIQINRAVEFAKEEGVPQPRRIPNSQSLALSTDVSMIDELNSSKITDDNDKIIEWPENLRQPYGLSPGLFYKANEDNASTRDKKETMRYNTESDTLLDNDTKACVSSTSSQSAKIEAMQGAVKKTAKTSEKPSASVPLSKTIEKSDDKPIGDKEIIFQDEAACLPLEIPTPSENDDVEKLTEELANLDTIARGISERRAKILQKISKKDSKHPNKCDDEAMKENYPNNCNQGNGPSGVGRKWAPTFGNSFGVGRNALLNSAAFEKLKPNRNTEKQCDSVEIVGSTVKNGNLIRQ